MSADDPLIPLAEAAERLNVSVETTLRYARRYKWRKIKGNDGVLVAVPSEMLAKPEKPAQDQHFSAPPAPPTIDPVAIVQAAVAPLQAALDRSDGDRRILQQQADAVREQLAAVQVERAEIAGVASAEKARREEIERRLADAKLQIEELRQQAESRRWWWPF